MDKNKFYFTKQRGYNEYEVVYNLLFNIIYGYLLGKYSNWCCS